MEEQLLILLDVIIACFLAGIVGLERELSNKPAGFRTHMIIGGVAALLIELGYVLIDSYEGRTLNQFLQTDPIRIFEAIVVGISFIGAGTILKIEKSSDVRYLTTAASILISAAIGICVGLNQYILAVGVTIAIIIINYLLNFVEEWLEKRKEKAE